MTCPAWPLTKNATGGKTSSVSSAPSNTPSGDISDRTSSRPAAVSSASRPTDQDRVSGQRHGGHGPAPAPPAADTDGLRRLPHREADGGSRGVVMVCIRSCLGSQRRPGTRHAGPDDGLLHHRELFDRLLDVFHQRSLQRIKAALEAGLMASSELVLQLALGRLVSGDLPGGLHPAAPGARRTDPPLTAPFTTSMMTANSPRAWG